MSELELLSKKLQQATSSSDVFGRIDGDARTQTKIVQKRYHALARAVHPDAYVTPQEKLRAQAAFVRLQLFKQAALSAIKNNTYGQVPTLATISTRMHTYHVRSKIGGDSFTDWFVADREDSVILRLHIAKSPAKNAYVANQATLLRTLYMDNTDSAYRPYLPKIVDSFVYRVNGINRRALVFEQLEGWMTLESLHTYKPIVQPLDMAWIWRRLLVPLGYAHQNGVVHGAVLPSTIALQLQEHGLILGGWYSAQSDSNGSYAALKTGIAQYHDWYPKEVINNQPVSPATDIAMAAKTMAWLMGEDPLTGNLPSAVPSSMRAFFKSCMQGNMHTRPQNAWMLIHEFDQLLERLGRPYWPHTFRPFTVHVS